MTSLLSSRVELESICSAVRTCLRLPFFDQGANVPGALLEAVIGEVRESEVLATYDFVDVIRREAKVGWQVKSTKDTTPVTWKRAKIPDRDRMIHESEGSPTGLQALGDAILTFCNDHARESLERYGLDAIGFSRLVRSENAIFYYERELCNQDDHRVFAPEDFEWTWSKPKKTKVKEQLSALHGIHRPSGAKWFAWHGRGENQLHFSGEKTWWPEKGSPHRFDFSAPSAHEKLSLTELASLLGGP